MNGKLLPRDADDQPWYTEADGTKVPAEDGAELIALISIMLGAMRKEAGLQEAQAQRIDLLEAEVERLQARLN